jgi:hypothetical protein
LEAAMLPLYLRGVRLSTIRPFYLRYRKPRVHIQPRGFFYYIYYKKPYYMQAIKENPA